MYTITVTDLSQAGKITEIICYASHQIKGGKYSFNDFLDLFRKNHKGIRDTFSKLVTYKVGSKFSINGDSDVLLSKYSSSDIISYKEVDNNTFLFILERIKLLLSKYNNIDIYLDEPDVIYVNTYDKLNQLIIDVKETGMCFFDTETQPKAQGISGPDLKKHSVDFTLSMPTMVQVAAKCGKVYCIPLYHTASPFRYSIDDVFNLNGFVGLLDTGAYPKSYSGDRDELIDFNYYYSSYLSFNGNPIDIIVKELSNIFGAKDITKVAHNATFDMKVLAKLGVYLAGDFEDTMEIYNYILEYKPNGLDDHTLYVSPNNIGYWEKIDFANEPIDSLYKYGAMDVHITAKSYIYHTSILMQDERLYKTYRSLEVPKVTKLFELEYNGADIDVDLVIKTKDELIQLSEEITHKIQQHPIVIDFVQSRNEWEKNFYIKQLDRKLLLLAVNKVNSTNKTLKLFGDTDVSYTKDELKYIQLRNEAYLRNDFYTKVNIDSPEELSESIFEQPYERASIRTDIFIDKCVLCPIIKEGRIIDINVEKAGKGYSQSYSYITVTDSNGAGFYGIPILNKEGGISRIEISYTGQGYKNPQIDILSFSNEKDVRKYLYNGYMNASNKPSGLCISHKSNDMGKRYISTSDDILKNIKDNTGLIQLIRDHRAVNKLLNTYFEGFINLLSPDNKLHTRYNTVKSMRISSSGPNLQNIPSRTSIDVLKKHIKKAKQVFCTPSDDYVMFQIDLSQAELRWIAELWDVKSMQEAYKKDIDIHSLTASAVRRITIDEFYELPEAERKTLRFQAKSINFGYCYGMLARKFKDMALNDYGIKLSLQEAEEWRKLYFEQYPEIMAGHRKYHIQAHKKGYVETAFGTKRHLLNVQLLDDMYDISTCPTEDLLQNADNSIKDYIYKVLSDERIAINSPVQGTSGQALLFSLIQAMDLMSIFDIDGRIVNTVHDSIVGYVRKDQLDDTVTILQTCCENPAGAEEFLGYWLKKVPMKSDVEVGPNWGELYPYKK